MVVGSGQEKIAVGTLQEMQNEYQGEPWYFLVFFGPVVGYGSPLCGL